MHYDPEYLARFYDAYDLAEWDRLEVLAYGRLQAVIHADFIKQHVRRGGARGRHRQRSGAILGRGCHARGGADPG